MLDHLEVNPFEVLTMIKSLTPGQLLKKTRRAKKETQSKVGARIGVAKSQISHIEHGNRVLGTLREEFERIEKGYQFSQKEKDEFVRALFY